MGELLVSLSAILAIACSVALSNRSAGRRRRPVPIHRLEAALRLVCCALALEAGIWLALMGIHIRWLPGRVHGVVIGWWFLAPSLAAGVIGLVATKVMRGRDSDDGDMTMHSEPA